MLSISWPKVRLRVVRVMYVDLGSQIVKESSGPSATQRSRIRDEGVDFVEWRRSQSLGFGESLALIIKIRCRSEQCRHFAAPLLDQTVRRMSSTMLFSMDNTDDTHSC